MAAYPLPVNLMFNSEGRQLLPEVLIGKGVGSFEAAAAHPAGQPFAHPPHQILRIAVKAHPLATVQRFEPADRRDQLHALRGGIRLKAAELLLCLAEAQDYPITPWSGIPPRAVAIDFDDPGRRRSEGEFERTEFELAEEGDELRQVRRLP